MIQQFDNEYGSSADDKDDAIDHYAECEDELNCNCENITPCPVCNGYGAELDKDYCSAQCDYGFILKDEFEAVYERHFPRRNSSLV